MAGQVRELPTATARTVCSGARNFRRVVRQMMSLAARFAGIIIAGCIVLSLVPRKTVELDRWFVPGELGYESGGPGMWGGRIEFNERNHHLAGRSRSPGYLTRFLSLGSGKDASEWAEHNELTEPMAFSHHLDAVFPPALFDTHPDFFPLVDGERWRPPEKAPYWNPDLGRTDVAAYAADVAMLFFDANPDETIFSLGVNDGFFFGTSPEIGALVQPIRWFREKPDYSPLIFTFMNRAAARLARTHPDKRLGALAYYWAENTPGFPVDPHVVPFLTADRSQGYDEVFRREELNLQDKWGATMRAGAARAAAQNSEIGDRGSEIGKAEAEPGFTGGSGGNEAAHVAKLAAPGSKLEAPDSGLIASSHQRSTLNSPLSALNFPLRPRLGLYDYLYGEGFLVPRIFPHLLAENLRHAHEAGFTDYYAEVYPNWGLAGPMPWLAAQLAQDPKQPLASLLDEYYTRFFHEAAPAMRSFFERCEQQWMNQPGPPYWLKYFRNEDQAALFPSGVCRELRGLLTKAAQEARDDRASARVQLVSDAFGVTERFVALQEARMAVTDLSLRPEAGWREIRAELGRYRAARAEVQRYAADLLLREPLAMAPTDWSSYLHNDPTALAVGAIHARAAAEPAQLAAADAVMQAGDGEIPALWQAEVAGRWQELLDPSEVEGPLTPARTEFGVPTSLADPAGWESRVVPWRTFRSEWSTVAPRVLRIESGKRAQLLRAVPVGGAVVHRASLEIRGHVSTGSNASVHLRWVDAQGQWQGDISCRLPEGDWPTWQTIAAAGVPSAEAPYACFELVVVNQPDGDWVEVRHFSLAAAEP